MSHDHGDLLDLVQRIIGLIDSAQHNSTYKFAALLALIDICAEQSAPPNSTIEIPINEIAHRFVAYYWDQSREFTISLAETPKKTTWSDAGKHLEILRQNQQHGRSIPDRVRELRCHLEATAWNSPEAAREARNPAYEKLVYDIELTIAQQPLAHLQTPGKKPIKPTASHAFIFDPSNLSKKMRRTELNKNPNIRLRPNVAFAFRLFAPLLKSLVERRWTSVVASLNRSDFDVPDLESFLFDHRREATQRAKDPLRNLQGNKCFYCGSIMTQNAHVDHVIPWSRIPINGISNLVLAHERCNLNKSDTLPSWSHLQRALQRPAHELQIVSKICRLPVLARRTEGAARGIYSSLPKGTVLWEQIDTYQYYGDEFIG